MNQHDQINELLDIEAGLQALLMRTSRLRVQMQGNTEIKTKKSKANKALQQKALNNIHKTIRKRNMKTAA